MKTQSDYYSKGRIEFKVITTCNSWGMIKGLTNRVRLPLLDFYNLLDSRKHIYMGYRVLKFKDSDNPKPYIEGTWTYGIKCIYSFKEYEKIGFLIGRIVTIGVAGTWEKHYGWSDYTYAEYTIEAMSDSGILARRESNSLEMIKVTNEDLDKGRFEVWVRRNYAYYREK